VAEDSRYCTLWRVLPTMRRAKGGFLPAASPSQSVSVRPRFSSYLCIYVVTLHSPRQTKKGTYVASVSLLQIGKSDTQQTPSQQAISHILRYGKLCESSRTSYVRTVREPCSSVVMRGCTYGKNCTRTLAQLCVNPFRTRTHVRKSDYLRKQVHSLRKRSYNGLYGGPERVNIVIDSEHGGTAAISYLAFAKGFV
jgi:hypothetical protein